uniref:Protocadherin-1 n=1 Tax=Schistocephalus solidus TaxID=70667 RepID=A0A0X3NQM4_SCHSO
MRSSRFIFSTLPLLTLIIASVQSCNYVRSITVQESNSLEQGHSKHSGYASRPLAALPQEISLNLSKLFQEELNIADVELSSTAIYFTDATESRPFVIKSVITDGRSWYQMTTDQPIDREVVCNELRFPHRAAIARKCCLSAAKKTASLSDNDADFSCCLFVDITVGTYGTYAIRVQLIDVNDNAPRFAPPMEAMVSTLNKDNVVVLHLPENMPQGTVIPLPQATDPDDGKNAALIYQIDKFSPSALWQQHFRILTGTEGGCLNSDFSDVQHNAPIPSLCLLKSVDREVVSGFQFELIARDQGVPIFLSATLSISIIIQDENDNAPIFKTETIHVLIKENQIGKSFARLRVNDTDTGENARVSYYLRPSNNLKANQMLGSDFLRTHILVSPVPDGVVLRLIQPLDYEQVDAFDFLVIAQDHGTPKLASTATVSVEIENVNDQSPVIRFFDKGNMLNSEYASLERNEDVTDHAPNIICHVHVYDMDSSLDEIFCDIDSPQRHFDLREVSTENTAQRRKIFELLTTVSLDREESPSYLVRVRCADGRTSDRLIGQSQIRIILRDINDNGPVFQRNQYFGIVPENEVNTIVDFRESFLKFGTDTKSTRPSAPLHIHATDLDVGQNAMIIYSLVDVYENGSNKDASSDISQKSTRDSEYFYIDRVTGQLKTRVALDFEKKSIYNFLVIAADQPLDPTQALSSTAKVTVYVRDVDDNAPIMAKPEYNFEVMEGMPSHTVIGRVEATDADNLPENRVVFYDIHPSSMDNSARFFTVDRLSGVIRTARPLDREQVSKLQIKVIATSGGGQNMFGRSKKPMSQAFSSTTIVTVTVLDKNDNAPYMVSTKSHPDPSQWRSEKKVLLAEFAITPDQLHTKGACVDFPFAFFDDDDYATNGNVTVSLDENSHFTLNEEAHHICVKSDKPPPPGRYSLNILAHDNPTDPVHRLTKRFPLRILVQSPKTEIIGSEKSIGEEHTNELSLRPQYKVGIFSQYETDGAANRISEVKPRTHDPSPGARKRLPPSSNGKGEYRNVTIIAVLVCMACVLCLILLAILLFLRKCTPSRRTFSKRHTVMRIGNGNHNNSIDPTVPHELTVDTGDFHSLSQKRLADIDSNHFPCGDIQAPVLMTMLPGSDKNYPNLSSDSHLMSNIVYIDESGRFSPTRPKIIEKNNSVIPSTPEVQWAIGRDHPQKLTITPIYGLPRLPPTTESLLPNLSPRTYPAAQYRTDIPTDISAYRLLLQSKSCDELDAALINKGNQVTENRPELSPSSTTCARMENVSKENSNYHVVASLVKNQISKISHTSAAENGYQGPNATVFVDEYTPMIPITPTAHAEQAQGTFKIVCDGGSAGSQGSPRQANPRNCETTSFV